MNNEVTGALRSPAKLAIARVRTRLLMLYLSRYPAGKKTIDVVLAGFGLLVLSPVLITVAITIKLTSKGPVLFWQKRVGKWGIEFDFPKFRSMRVDAEDVRSQIDHLNQHGKGGVTFKLKNDPRVTAIGRLIRRTSVDELPQLWCVLKGNMSLVGPRPSLPAEVRRYTVLERRRMDVRPGLTCIWQTEGRSDVPFEEQVQMDLEYISDQSLLKDLWLIVKTLPAVVLGRGAY